jgi:hypothetical protein
MQVLMLRNRGYRGSHCEAGTVVEMDERTARQFIESGWASMYAEPGPLPAAVADEVAPVKVAKRKALR